MVLRLVILLVFIANIGFSATAVNKEFVNSFRGSAQLPTDAGSAINRFKDNLKVKDKNGALRGYSDDAASDINGLQSSSEQVTNWNNLLMNFTPGGNKEYTCVETRIVKVIPAYKCPETGVIYDSADVCNTNCYKPKECINICEQATTCNEVAECPDNTVYSPDNQKCVYDAIYQSQCSMVYYSKPGNTWNKNKVIFFDPDGTVHYQVWGVSFWGGVSYMIYEKVLKKGETETQTATWGNTTYVNKYMNLSNQDYFHFRYTSNGETIYDVKFATRTCRLQYYAAKGNPCLDYAINVGLSINSTRSWTCRVMSWLGAGWYMYSGQKIVNNSKNAGGYTCIYGGSLVGDKCYINPSFKYECSYSGDIFTDKAQCDESCNFWRCTNTGEYFASELDCQTICPKTYCSYNKTNYYTREECGNNCKEPVTCEEF